MKKLLITSVAIILAAQASAQVASTPQVEEENALRKTWILVMETVHGLTHVPDHMHKPACEKALAGLVAEFPLAKSICLNFATGEVVSKDSL